MNLIIDFSSYFNFIDITFINLRIIVNVEDIMIYCHLKHPGNRVSQLVIPKAYKRYNLDFVRDFNEDLLILHPLYPS